MATVTTLDVKIRADIQSFEQGMAKMEGQLKQVGQNLRAVGGTLSRAITLPILGIGGAAIKAASDVEEMQAKFNTVFKNVGGEVSKELGNFAKQVNRSRYDLQGMAATFGDIIKPMGFTEESAADMSVTLTKLAVDLSSFNNMPMDEAVRRLRGTLIGAHENAADFGVIINENTLKQELMRMGAHKLTGAQKEQAKAQARMNLLLAGTTDAQGDAIRTAGSFANQMRGLRDNVRDLGVEIGEILLPYATSLVQELDRMVDIVSNLSPTAQRLGIVIAGIAAAAGPLIFSLGGIASSFSAILKAITLTMGMFNPYVAGIAAIAAILIALYRNAEAVQAAFFGIYTEIKDRTAPIIEAMKEAVGSLFKKVGEWVESAVDIGAAIFGTIASWWNDNGPMLIQRLTSIFGAIGSFLGSATELLGTVISRGLDLIKYVWARWGADIVDTMGFIINTVLTITEKGFENLSLLIGAVTSILNNDWNTAGDLIKEGFRNSLAGIDDIVADFKKTFLNKATTSADEFLDKFDIKGFEHIIYYALKSSETDIQNFRKNALEGPLGLLVGAEKLDELFGSEEFSKIIESALNSSETTVRGFKTESLLAIRAGAETLDNNFGATEFQTLMEDVFRSSPDLVKEFVQRGLEFANDFKEGIKDKILDDPDSVGESVKGAIEKVEALGVQLGELDMEVLPNNAPQLISEFALNLQNLQGNLDLVGEEADELSRKFNAVFEAIDRLGIDDKSMVYRAFSWLSVASADLTLFTDGFNQLIDLLNPSTYKDFFEGLKGGFRSLSNLSMSVGDKIVGIFSDKQNGFSDFIGKLSNSEGIIGTIAGSLGKWVPGIAAAAVALKAFGIDAGDVLNGIKNVVGSIGTGIKNIFGKASEEQKKAARLNKFISEVARLGVDLSNLTAVDKKAIEAIMAPILTSGIASREELIAILGLDPGDLGATLSDAFGMLLLGAQNRGGDAMTAGIEAILNDVGASLGQQFGMEAGEVMRQLFEFLGVDMDEAIRLAEEAKQRQRDRERGVDVDGETGIDTGRPTVEGGTQVDTGAIAGIGGMGMSGSSVMSGIASSVMSSSSSGLRAMSQTVNVILDGQQIATATVPYMAGELELYGTNY
jgi:hypothetical protein